MEFKLSGTLYSILAINKEGEDFRHVYSENERRADTVTN
jgi:hypothetical protein